MTRVLDTTSPLDLEPLPDAGVLDGAPRAGARVLATFGTVEVGVWEMTDGTATDTEVDEVFVVISGSGSVTFDGGEVVELGPGVTVRLHAGDRTTWTVREPLRKVYVADA